jgi:CDGSH-type Zn-finger protein
MGYRSIVKRNLLFRKLTVRCGSSNCEGTPYCGNCHINVSLSAATAIARHARTSKCNMANGHLVY